jgi:hypothetical protein
MHKTALRSDLKLIHTLGWASVLMAASLLGMSALANESAGIQGSDVRESDATSTAQAAQYEDFEVESPFSAHYFGILYGPSVQNPTSYQPTPSGRTDKNTSVAIRNFGSLAYQINDLWSTSATATFDWIPVRGQTVTMRDPYVRVANNSIFSTDDFNLYGDLRVHMPVTDASRNQDMLSGIQTLAIATYIPPESRFTFALFGSSRYNIFGSLGEGNDLELYLGPNLSYQITPTLAFTTLYEMGASHRLGQQAFELNNDGTDLEPGFRWDVTPKLTVNPYLNIYTGNKVNLASTSLGMTLSWQLL